MIELAEGPARRSAFAAFGCYWIAFNNIYVTVATDSGLKPTPTGQGTLGKLRMPRVRLTPERDQIAAAVAKLTRDTKDKLIHCPAVRYFVERKPRWELQEIAVDAFGQTLNGVLNIGKTIDADHPVWSPIDAEAYERYLEQPNIIDQDSLAKQLVDMLYTIRNNMFHGGKRVDDAYAREVVEKATPLLKVIVNSFCESPPTRESSLNN